MIPQWEQESLQEVRTGEGIRDEFGGASLEDWCAEKKSITFLGNFLKYKLGYHVYGIKKVKKLVEYGGELQVE